MSQEELNWFLFQENQQLGPFSSQQVKQMHTTNMIAQDAYIFKVGWKDWRPIEEVFEEELGIKLKKGHVLPERRINAPRATIAGKVIVHNNGQLVIGSGVNISATGVFIETAEKVFQVGEKLKLTIKAEGFTNSFNAVASVVRFNDDPKAPVGFGLKFENLDQRLAAEIQHHVELASKKKLPRKKA